jgi:thiamine-monophosphate kinase
MASVERELHDWLRQQIDDSTSSSVLLGVGDDAAVIQGQTCPAVVSTDTIAQGTHFLVAEHSLELIGRKSLAVNLSDIAAMGAKPRTILLHWLLPDDFTLEQAKSLFFGVQQLADQYNVHVVGGDTNCWSGVLSLARR